MKKRNSSYEIMRIISMLFIVLYHVISHGKVLTNYNNPGAKLLLEILLFIIIIHVNSFVLLAGYFQCESKFKQRKLWELINASLFYKISIIIFLIILGVNIDKLTIFKELIPINTVEYWFIKCYFFLYCLTPFINKGIENLNKKYFTNLLLVLIFIFSIIPSYIGLDAFNNDGYTLYHFILMYLIGAYLKKYPLQNNYIFKNFSKKLFQIILIILFFLMPLINISFTSFAEKINNTNFFFNFISKNITLSSLAYNNPLIIIQSIVYFSFFGTFNFYNKFINKLSSLTLGVYFIHDNNFVRERLYKFLKVDIKNITSYKFILYIILISIIIYLVCIIIEFIRKLIFKFIYNRKISSKIRNKYYAMLAKI